jgi:hypothetical protein
MCMCATAAAKRSSPSKEEIALRESHGLKVKELARAQQLAEENKRLIVQKWHEHLA